MNSEQIVNYVNVCNEGIIRSYYIVGENKIVDTNFV